MLPGKTGILDNTEQVYRQFHQNSEEDSGILQSRQRPHNS